MAKTKNKLSVIIPIYNCEKYVRNCVESITSQGLNEKIEIIIIDDGSTDKSGRICDELIKKNKNIIVFHRKNYGVSNARNFGLEKSSGEYIYFVDADDIIFSGCLEYIIKMIEYNPDIISVGYQKIADDADYKKIKIRQLSSKMTSSITETMERFSLSQNIIKGELLKKNNLRMNEKLRYTEDMDLALEAIVLANKIVVVDSAIYGYRDNGSSATKVINSKMVEDLLYFINKWSKIVAKIQDVKTKEYLGSFLAYQILIALGVDNLNDSVMLDKIDYGILLQYHKTKKTKLGYICYKLMGLKKMAMIMGRYLALKGMKKGGVYE